MGKRPRYEVIAQREEKEALHKERVKNDYVILKKINKLSNLDLLDLCFSNDEVRTSVSRTMYKSNPSYESWVSLCSSGWGTVAGSSVLQNLRIVLSASDNFLDHKLSFVTFKRIFEYEKDFVRPINTWVPKSRNAHQQLLSLIRHLFAKYPTPSFLEKSFSTSERDGSNRGILLYIHMGAGKSLKTFTGFPNWLSLHNRSLHHLYTTPDEMDLVSALRRCQVLYMGGDEYIFNALMRANILRENLPVTRLNGETEYKPLHDEFWLTVMKFFIENRMIVTSKIAEVIDYINNIKYVTGRAMDENGRFHDVPPQHPNLSMKGRNPQTLIDQSDEWHYNRARLQRANQRLVQGNRYLPSSSMKDYSWQGSNIRNITIARGKDTKYHIIQLKSFFELRDEGTDMHHCVGTYASSCSNGKCAIFSVRQFIKGQFFQRTATIEVRGNNVEQIRGKYNRKPDDTTMNVIKDWAYDEVLNISKYAT